MTFNWLHELHNPTSHKKSSVSSPELSSQEPDPETCSNHPHGDDRTSNKEQDDISVEQSPISGLLEQLSFLVVDDVPASCKLLSRLLREVGALPGRVVCAHSVLEAKRYLQRYPINIVMSDLNLPRQTGIDLLRSMRGDPNMQHTPFVLVTNSLDRSSLDEARKIGASSILTKPLSVEAVTDGLKRALAEIRSL